MRRSTAYNQRLDRQRLSFATGRKCGKRVHVFGAEGRDVSAILYENRFRLANRIELEIEMECESCCETGDRVSSYRKQKPTAIAPYRKDSSD